MPAHKHSRELKLIHGVDPGERIDDTPRPSQREPQRPKSLSLREGRQWNHVVTELRDMGLLSSADTNEILLYVQMLALIERIWADLSAADRLVIANVDTGVVRSHPLIAAYDRAVGRAHVLASALGLNPHGRSLIHGREVRPDTERAHVRELYS